ncbi:MAG: hypothetical protein NUW21_04540 [Elusimicrobia bacterium]|nr:hypothetical protein [Elusimicrobiota bacterium]
MAAAALESANAESSAEDASAESEAAAPEADLSESLGSPATPDQGWQFPGGREQYEDLVRNANAGREFAGNADIIREALRRGLMGGNVPNSPEAKQADEQEEFRAHFGSHAAWQKHCEDMKHDHNVYVRGVQAIVQTARKADVDALKAMEKKLDAYENDLRDLRGFKRLASHRFAESEDWKTHGKAVEELLTKNIVNVGDDPDRAIAHAFEYAKLQAKAKGATNAQASKAGASAAKAVAVASGVPAGKAAAAVASAKRPGPRVEPSLDGGTRSGKGMSDDDEKDRKVRLSSSKHYFTRLAEQAVKKAAAEATGGR